MKLNVGENQYYEEDASEGVSTKKVGIAIENMGLFYKMMSKAIYSDPIGSIVRELVSNCFDAHQEIGEKKPVMVSKKLIEGHYRICFEDFGVGISPERFDKIYLNYLDSTKRQSNDYLGAFGIGSKSPFSYADQYFIRTRYDGIEYLYIMATGSDDIPGGDLMYAIPTTKPNGTEVSINIETKHGWDGDVSKFEDAIKTQLAYFDDVYVSGFDIDNNYTIYEKETFKYRAVEGQKQMKLLLGKVIYPINWTVLKRAIINIPVAVKFEIGELMVTSNREAIRYDDVAAVNAINERINKCLNELSILSEDYEIEDYNEFYKANQETNGQEKYVYLTKDVKIPVYKNEFNKYPIKIGRPIWKALGFKIPKYKDPYFLYKHIATVQNESYHKLGGKTFKHSTFQVGRLLDNPTTDVFRLVNKDKPASLWKNRFIKNGFIIEKQKLTLKEIADFIKLQKEKEIIDRVEITLHAAVLKFKTELIKYVESKTQLYDDLDVQAFIDANRQKYATKKSISNQETIFAYPANASYKEPYKLAGRKFALLYGHMEHRNTLKALDSILPSKIKAIIINKADAKLMQESKNAVSLHSFVTNNPKFNKYITAAYICQSYHALSINIERFFKYIPKLKSFYTEVQALIKETHISNHVAGDKFVQELITMAVEEGCIIEYYVQLMDLLKQAEEDLMIIKNAVNEKNTLDDERKIAKFIVSLGYSVDPYFLFVPNEKELETIGQAISLNEYWNQVEQDYNSTSYSYKKNNFKFKRPCQVNFPSLPLNKSVKISMLPLLMQKKNQKLLQRQTLLKLLNQ